ARGSAGKKMLPPERAVRDRLAKSIVARQDIPAGTKITADMLTVKGPGTGLKPNAIQLLVGVVAESPIEGDTLVPAAALKWRRSWEGSPTPQPPPPGGGEREICSLPPAHGGGGWGVGDDP